MQQVTQDVRLRIKTYDRRMHHAIEYEQICSSSEINRRRNLRLNIL